MRERRQGGKGEKLKVEMGVRRREGESYEQPFPSLIHPLIGGRETKLKIRINLINKGESYACHRTSLPDRKQGEGGKQCENENEHGRRERGGSLREREHGNYMKDSVNMIITQLPLSLSLAPHNYSIPSNFFTLMILS